MLPLLLDSRPFGGPTDAAAYATLATLIAYYVLEMYFVNRAGGGKVDVRTATDRGTFLMAGLLQIAALVLAIALGYWVDSLALPDALWVPGLAVSWLGIALRMWSIHTLGPFFRRVVVVQADHRVVDRGPYRFVRHPAYTGVLLFVAGWGLAQANVLSIIVTLVLPFIGYYRRIKVEEQVLSTELGAQFVEYARTRRRLIPGVW